MAGSPIRRARKLAALKAAQEAALAAGETVAPIAEAAPSMPERARPTLFDQALADLICERIALGETLTRICRDRAFPTRGNVWHWMRANEEFEAAYKAARAHAPHAWSDDVIEISDDGRNDTQVSPDGVTVLVNADTVQRSRLRVESRFRLMAALNPETYAQRTKVDMTVSEGLARDLEEGRKRALAAAQGEQPQREDDGSGETVH